MPKNNKKGKVATAKVAEDFDDMLDEFRAADRINPAANPSAPASSSSNCSSSSSSISSSVLPPSGPPIGRTIPEEDITQAVLRGDLEQLKRWAGQGVRVHTAEPLCQAAAWGKLEIVRYLVKELAADVNLRDMAGSTPLFMAAQEGLIAVVRYLVNDLGAEVDRASPSGITPLDMAVMEGHLELVAASSRNSVPT
jgi:hypothetical protein